MASERNSHGATWGAPPQHLPLPAAFDAEDAAHETPNASLPLPRLRWLGLRSADAVDSPVQHRTALTERDFAVGRNWLAKSPVARSEPLWADEVRAMLGRGYKVDIEGAAASGPHASTLFSHKIVERLLQSDTI